MDRGPVETRSRIRRRATGNLRTRSHKPASLGVAERNDIRPQKTSVTIQDVDRESMKYMKTERDDPSWAAQEGQLLIPASNLDFISDMRSTGTSMDIFVRGVGVGLTHTENLIIKKLRITRET